LDISFHKDGEIMKETLELIEEEIRSTIETEPDLIANFANVSALLYHALNRVKGNCVNWCGFYRVIDKDTLILGPFQGHTACIRIPFGFGVCGTAAQRQETISVPDVSQWQQHIACDSNSKSELVIPVFDSQTQLIAVLDIDANVLNAFSESDVETLEKAMASFQRPTPPSPKQKTVTHPSVHTSESK